MLRKLRLYKVWWAWLPVVYILGVLFSSHKKTQHSTPYIRDHRPLDNTSFRRPIVCIANYKLELFPDDNPFAETMGKVFRRLGYDISTSPTADWDILWLDIPGTIERHSHKLLDNIKPYQRINAVPGNRIITDKDQLTKRPYPFVPKTFRIPEDNMKLIKYAMKHRNTTYVHKTILHRGQGVRFVKQADLKPSKDRSTIQVFIDNPFLIDGRKFDIQVYASVSSADPLRIYIQNDEYLIRLCPADYHPFDRNIVDKYVVSVGKMILPWMDEIPSLKGDYYKHNLTNKEITFSYLRSKGISTNNIEKQIMDAVYGVYIANERDVMKRAFEELKGSYYHPRHFIQLIRFDFVLDVNGKLWLMEVNAGPGMVVETLPERRRQIERTFYSFLKLNGVALPTRRAWDKSEDHEKEMIVSDRDISTFVDRCRSNLCDSCDHADCQMCTPCLTEDQKAMLHQAYVEHTHKTNWKRALPKPFKNQQEAETWIPERDMDFRKLSSNSQFLTRWFWGKCLQDDNWCS